MRLFFRTSGPFLSSSELIRESAIAVPNRIPVEIAGGSPRQIETVKVYRKRF